MITPLLISVAVGYVLGALPFGYLVAKAKGVNIFEVGSKNPGATNVRRTLGAGAGNTVFALDTLKGILAVLIPLILQLTGSADGDYNAYVLGGLGGLIGAVLGHSFSCFTGFRGGKGVATAAGGLFVLMPTSCLIAAVAWVIAFFASRYVSLASIVAAAVIVVTAWLFSASLTLSIVASLLGILVIVRHKSNIQRLLAGTEHRWEKKKSADSSVSS